MFTILTGFFSKYSSSIPYLHLHCRVCHRTGVFNTKKNSLGYKVVSIQETYSALPDVRVLDIHGQNIK